MFRTLLLAIALAAVPFASAASDDDGHDHASPATHETPVHAEAGEVVVAVKGLVCSFCAVGLGKRLGELPELDRSRHNKGLLVDVDAGLVRFALLEGQPAPFRAIARGVKRAGYEAKRFHLLVEGSASEGGGFESVVPPQRFVLAAAPPQPQPGSSLQLRVEAADVAELDDGAPVPATPEPRAAAPDARP